MVGAEEDLMNMQVVGMTPDIVKEKMVYSGGFKMP
jgi:hypothetical protein